MQDLFSCLSPLDLVLYLLGPHLLVNKVPMCTFSRCLFRALRRGQTFPQVWQSFVFDMLCVINHNVLFLPELLGTFTLHPSSEAVAGSACGGEGWVA